MNFEDYPISKELKLNIDKLGFKKPTDIQYKAIPSILRGEDVLGIAQTGTGKTAAFVIPLIYMIQKKLRSEDQWGVQCIVFEPTHELAIQITEVFESMIKGTGVKVLCLQGGVDQAPQIKALKEGVHIVITTPGRMFDLAAQGHLDLQYVDQIVLDEADHMLDLGFIKDAKDLTKWIPRKRQTLFFSATINPEIKKVAYSLVKNPIRIQISPKDPVSKNVDHGILFVSMDDKRFFLEKVIKEHVDAKILIFVRTIVRAERVLKAMDRVGIAVETIHRDKTEEERFAIMERFKSGENKLLIATDINSRGVDIPDVDLVVNYDMPNKDENYVHRIGRTGRGRKRGVAISFVSPEEEEMLAEIEQFVGNPLQIMDVSKGTYNAVKKFTDNPEGDIDSMMKEIAEFEEIHRRKKKKQKKGKGKKK